MEKIKLLDAPTYYGLIGPWLRSEDEDMPEPHQVKFGDSPGELWESDGPALRTGAHSGHLTYRRVKGKGRRIIDVNYRGPEKGFKHEVFVTS